MIERAFYLLALTFVLLAGLRASWTDLHTNKVYNKDIILFLIIGFVIQTSSIIFFGTEYLLPWVIAFFFICVLAYSFYVSHIWAAGDAKLIIALFFGILSCLFPSWQDAIPYAILLPGFIFSIGFIYIFVESVIFLIHDIRHRSISISPRIIFKTWPSQLSSWLLSYNMICLCHLAWAYVTKNISIPSWIILAFDFAFVSVYFHIVDSKTKKKVSGIAILLVRIVFTLLGLSNFSSFLPVIPLMTAVLILLLRMLISRYNYREIPTENIRVGHILAQTSMPFMMVSSVKGLPKTTDETTRSRLSQEEVDAIHRWKSSKYGQYTVWIVRHMPFAPFISVGTVVYLLFLIFMR